MTSLLKKIFLLPGRPKLFAMTLLSLVIAVSSCSGGSVPHQPNTNTYMNSTTGQDLTVPSPVKEFVEAVNAGDEAAFLSFFDENKGVINDWGRVMTGHKEIKAWSDKEFIGAKGKMTPQRVETKGNVISLWAGWKSSYYSGDSKFVFTVDGNRVIEMRIESAK